MDIKTSAQLNELAAALAAAQTELENPKKTKTAKVFSKRTQKEFTYSYADFGDGLEKIRKALGKSGVAIIQTPTTEGDWVVIKTRLIHSSGQWIEGIMPVARIGIEPQEMGSFMTYARKQSLFSMAGICGEGDDNDGAGKNGSVIDANSSAIADAKDEFISRTQVNLLRSVIQESSADEAKFLEWLKVERFEDIRSSQFRVAVDTLKAARLKRLKNGEEPRQ